MGWFRSRAGADLASARWVAPARYAPYAGAGQTDEARRQLTEAVERGGAAAREAARQRPRLKELLEEG